MHFLQACLFEVSMSLDMGMLNMFSGTDPYGYIMQTIDRQSMHQYQSLIIQLQLLQLQDVDYLFIMHKYYIVACDCIDNKRFLKHSGYLNAFSSYVLDLYTRPAACSCI